MTFITFVFLIVPTLSFADSFSSGVTFAKNGISSANSNDQHFNPNQFQNYTNNPTQKQYYQNGQSDSLIKNAIPGALSNSNSAQSIENNYVSSHQYTVNESAPEIQKSNLMQSDAYDITHGISDNEVQCVQKSKICKTTYTHEYCDSSTPVLLTCTITPVVTISSTPYQVEAPYNGDINPSTTTYGLFQLPESGILQSISVVLQSPNIWRCSNNYSGFVNDTYISTYYPSCGKKLGNLSFSNNNLQLNVTKDQNISFQIKGGAAYGNWQQAAYSVTLLVTRYKNVASVQNQNSCENTPSQCTLSTSVCTQSGGVKTFDGINVTEPCWSTKNTYDCGSQGSNTCQPLIEEGCSVGAISCVSVKNGICAQYQDTMSCPTSTCPSNQMICGSGSFCTDGNCYEPTPSQNQNFGKNEAELAATTQSASSISNNQQTLSAFAGNAMSCSLAPIGFLNCCANSGWGKNIGLANCTQEEKNLGEDKENGYTVYVGKYCSHHVLGVCIEHRKAYCVFQGLLAKDIQQQGRQGQLGIGFGNSSSPNCSGLSVSQLQSIDFSKINFSNVEASLQNQANFPNSQNVQQYIAKKIKQEMNQ